VIYVKHTKTDVYILFKVPTRGTFNAW